MFKLRPRVSHLRRHFACASAILNGDQLFRDTVPQDASPTRFYIDERHLMRFLQSASGGLEQPMLPTQPPTTSSASVSKRKNADDASLLGNIPKKPRNDPENIPNPNLKRKRELVITRGSSAVPQASQRRFQDPQRPSSRATRSESEVPSVAGPSGSKPNSKSSSIASTAGPSFARVRKKGKERDVPGVTVGEHEVEEDVRQMNTEADDLRDRSRASIASMTPNARTIELEFPPPKPTAANTVKSRVHQLNQRSGIAQTAGRNTDPTTPSRTGREGLVRIAEQETPQITKNRLFRGESKPPSARSGSHESDNDEEGTPSLSRRRNSLSMRGKRSSSTFESTGIITRPHTSVSDASLFKHIDPELPESHRVRQLLIWTALRAKDPSSSSSRGRNRKSVANQLPPNSSLPPLPPGASELLQELQDDLIRQLAERKIDTSAYSEPVETNGSWKLKENEQNIRNKARERLFTEQIEERKKEDLAWAEVAQFYNAHQSSVLSAINQKNRASSKAKGKQRASSQEPESLEPWENELPDTFRGSNGYDVAKRLLQVGPKGVGKGDPRLEDLQYKEDHIHVAVSAARQLTQVAALDLDHRFFLLSASLAQRTLPTSGGVSLSSQQTLSNFVPAIALPTSRNAGPDTQDLFRALTRTDAARPRRQVGDAARRAAKDVQRARESQAHQSAEGVLVMQERKLTDVPPPTPRKPPGTPKRSNTPGASRR